MTPGLTGYRGPVNPTGECPCPPHHITTVAHCPVISSLHLVRFCPGEYKALANSWLIVEKGRSSNISRLLGHVTLRGSYQ